VPPVGQRTRVRYPAKGPRYLMNHLSPEEVAHLLSSVSALSARTGTSFSAALRQLIALAETTDAGAEARAPRDRRAFARRVLRVRQQRNAILGGDSFRDPAWDMLLDLYVQDASSAGTMVSALCIASGVPQTTALRYIYRLEQLGLVQTTDHPTDQRRTMVSLTETARSRIERLLDMMLDGN
jgi:DNA-binding MarR family transcriptional regulator